MRLIVAIAFAVAVTWTVESRTGVSPDTPVLLVLVEPDGEQFTQQEMDRAIVSTLSAMSWWSVLAPTPLSLVISDTIVITATGEIFNTTIDMTNSYKNSIYILDNSSSGRLIFNTHMGAMTSLHQVWIVTSAPNMEVTITHELGHMLYGLPDWYDIPGKCVVIDIMCFDYIAYTQKTIGCLSLEYMNHPCDKTYIPYISYPAPSHG